MEWDVVTGVSIGAVNGAGLSMFEKGREKEASQYLVDVWGNLTAGDIYQNWAGGVPAGLMWHEGIYDNSPESEFLRGTFEKFDGIK